MFDSLTLVSAPYLHTQAVSGLYVSHSPHSLSHSFNLPYYSFSLPLVPIAIHNNTKGTLTVPVRSSPLTVQTAMSALIGGQLFAFQQSLAPQLSAIAASVTAAQV